MTSRIPVSSDGPAESRGNLLNRPHAVDVFLGALDGAYCDLKAVSQEGPSLAPITPALFH